MRVFLLSIVILFSGCVAYSPSVPKNYSGETASIDDSFRRLSRSKANIYYVKMINGKDVYNGLVASSEASYGKGNQLDTRGATRLVPTNELKLYLVGQVHHPSAIGYMVNAGENYLVEGEITFTPIAGEKYLVNGRLSEEYSAVWIEDINGNVVSTVIEKKTSPVEDSESKTAAPANKEPFVEVTQPEIMPKKELTKEEYFLKLAGGESANMVLAKLGEPDSITKHPMNIFTDRPALVDHTYAGLGTIRYSMRNSKAEFVDRIIPDIKMSGDIGTIEIQLKSEGQALQSIAKIYHDADGLDVTALDLIAAKIWQDMGSKNSYTVDALSYLCKTLAKSGNARYRFFLGEVALKADRAKLRKYAKISFKLLPEDETPQFVPEEK